VNLKERPTRCQPVWCLCTTHRQTLFCEVWCGFNQGSYVCVQRGVRVGYWGWMLVGVTWVVCVHGGSLCSWSALRRGLAWAIRPEQAVYSQRRDGYEVQGCGRGGGWSVVLRGGRVMCVCEVGFEVLSEYGVDSGEGEHKQSRRLRAPVVRGWKPPPLVVVYPGGEDPVDVGPGGNRGEAWIWGVW